MLAGGVLQAVGVHGSVDPAKQLWLVPGTPSDKGGFVQFSAAASVTSPTAAEARIITTVTAPLIVVERFMQGEGKEVLVSFEQFARIIETV